MRTSCGQGPQMSGLLISHAVLPATKHDANPFEGQGLHYGMVVLTTLALGTRIQICGWGDTSFTTTMARFAPFACCTNTILFGHEEFYSTVFRRCVCPQYNFPLLPFLEEWVNHLQQERLASGAAVRNF
jgi:hypothetical protein